MLDFGFYLVLTNPVSGYEACAEAAVRAHVRMLQLRMKNASASEILPVAQHLRTLTQGTETKFIVNDDPALAAQVGADGVHVGQDDCSVEEVRLRYPTIPLVGLSTHNPEQVRKAALAQGRARPDYIGVGPVYRTPTKAIADPTLGLEQMGEMIRLSPFPAVAIGGINRTNLADVVHAGARNFAVVRPVCEASHPYEAICALQELWSACHT